MADAKTTPAKTIPVDQVREIYDLAYKSTRTTVSVLDAMCQRGAVKGEEMSAIGQLRDQSVHIAQLCEAFHSEYDEE